MLLVPNILWTRYFIESWSLDWGCDWFLKWLNQALKQLSWYDNYSSLTQVIIYFHHNLLRSPLVLHEYPNILKGQYSTPLCVKKIKHIRNLILRNLSLYLLQSSIIINNLVEEADQYVFIFLLSLSSFVSRKQRVFRKIIRKIMSGDLTFLFPIQLFEYRKHLRFCCFDLFLQKEQIQIVRLDPPSIAFIDLFVKLSNLKPFGMNKINFDLWEKLAALAQCLEEEEKGAIHYWKLFIIDCSKLSFRNLVKCL